MYVQNGCAMGIWMINRTVICYDVLLRPHKYMYIVCKPFVQENPLVCLCTLDRSHRVCLCFELIMAAKSEGDSETVF